MVPGWNNYVREAHAAARESFLIWQQDGKPRHGPVYEGMRHSRQQFKYALRRCRRVESQARADSLAKHLSSKKYSSFWKGIRSQKCTKLSNPTSIDGVSDEENILNHWVKHYKTVFSCNERNDVELNNVKDDLCNITFTDEMIVNSHDIMTSISSLGRGKAYDSDNLSSEHFIHAKQSVILPLCIFFSALLVHGYLPNQMIQSVIVPIVKSKTGSVTDKSNYRPIAISTVMSKIFESLLYLRMEPFLNTCPNQFGFKKNLGTELCNFTLKEVIKFYHNMGSHIFICYLDASSAFDRLSHTILFKKLIDKGVPLYLVRILCYWYLQQNIKVRWNGNFSESFTVTNGVRQGGILSPHLFNLYMDNLSIKLNKLPVGCCVNGVTINHLMYADDTVLIAPSVKGLQKLLDVTQSYGQYHNIVFNQNKTVCMHVIGKRQKWSGSTPSVKLNDKILKFVDEHKYLGHFIQKNLSDNCDMLKQIRSLYCRANMLNKKFGLCSDSVKVLLYKLFCANFYCGSLWCDFTQSVYNKIRVSYNNSFRILLKLPKFCSASEMFVYSDVPNFETLLRKHRYSLMTRIKNCNNLFVSAIFNSDMFFKSNFLSLYEASMSTSEIV